MFNLKKSIQLLQSGGIVAFPTETVYGLGGDAANPVALKKIFSIKDRPADHPLIVHIAELDQLSQWAVDISENALQLAKAFWPGPLTLILKKAPSVLDLVTGGQETIGLRIPNHPMALALLKEWGGGLAGPSANRFGRISPTTASAVQEELGSEVDLILDGGQCTVGVESTIVDARGDSIQILRPGMITVNQIEAIVPHPIFTKKEKSPRVSGSMASHYAPKTKTRLITSPIEVVHFPCALLTHTPWVINKALVNCISMPEDPAGYAHQLYHVLREVDKQGLQEILIEAVPDGSEWEAIRDRLKRASMNDRFTI